MISLPCGLVDTNRSNIVLRRSLLAVISRWFQQVWTPASMWKTKKLSLNACRKNSGLWITFLKLPEDFQNFSEHLSCEHPEFR